MAQKSTTKGQANRRSSGGSGAAAVKPVPAKSSARTAQPAPPDPPAGPPTISLADLLTHFGRYAGDLAGLFCLALALLTLLALLLPELASGLLEIWAAFLRLWMGWGAAWTALLVGLSGLWAFRRRFAPQSAAPFWARFVALELAAFSSLSLLAVIGGMDLGRAAMGMDGGRIGWALAEMLRRLLGGVGLGFPILVGLVSLLIFVLALFVALGIPGASAIRVRSAASTVDSADELPAAGISEAPLLAGDPRLQAQAAKRRPPALPPEFRKNFRLEPEETPIPGPPAPRAENLPPFDLLVREQGSRPDERTINQTAGLIEKTLAEFGIPAKVTGVQVGPTITQFAVVPGFLDKERPIAANGSVKTGTKDGGEEAQTTETSQSAAEAAEAARRMKVRVAQISALGRDLALALSAERLRIEAPVPGRPYVGIEVPNPRAAVVRMRPILESDVFARSLGSSSLAVALGRDVSGQPVVADLAKMPHLLIAGTTGSGKSVCIAALTTCLAMNNTPDDLRLVMIDPKMVELVRFNGLPHLYGKVETDTERIQGVLRWTVAEMERRYKVLEASHSRNLESYNRKARRRKNEAIMPRIVVLIDELADLMMSAPDQTEHTLVRLAQMARAVGIHLVVATQRPGVEVVTGLIKANFPSRISFAVASSIDSRVILDTVGAENLLGRGDMLYLPPDASGPQRLQGVLITDREVDNIINFWQKQLPAEAAQLSPWDEMIAQQEILADRDNLIERAIDVVRQERRAGASLLQRRLRIGYPRAARLMDELEELGVIAPANGGRDWDVLIERGDDGNDGERD